MYSAVSTMGLYEAKCKHFERLCYISESHKSIYWNKPRNELEITLKCVQDIRWNQLSSDGKQTSCKHFPELNDDSTANSNFHFKFIHIPTGQAVTWTSEMCLCLWGVFLCFRFDIWKFHWARLSNNRNKNGPLMEYTKWTKAYQRKGFSKAPSK